MKRITLGVVQGDTRSLDRGSDRVYPRAPIRSLLESVKVIC